VRRSKSSLVQGSSEKYSTPSGLLTLYLWKNNKKWRMCVDYMGLNKACPKDLFPLPRID
jgi:hypothetical protein